MAEPHISTFRVMDPYRNIRHLYTSNMGPRTRCGTPNFARPPFFLRFFQFYRTLRQFSKKVSMRSVGSQSCFLRIQNRRSHAVFFSLQIILYQRKITRIFQQNGPTIVLKPSCLATSGLRDVTNRIRHHSLILGNRFPARSVHKMNVS